MMPDNDNGFVVDAVPPIVVVINPANVVGAGPPPSPLPLSLLLCLLNISINAG